MIFYLWAVAREVIGWSAKPNSRGQYPDSPPFDIYTQYKKTIDNVKKRDLYTILAI